ncbi:MAG: xanthine dehydrogenase family protein molybdopterin-binding subunit [Chloroflexota bacterium]|nr:xanthine dehydrogenase family protein molybdopterin-binding subunit [Chloroflexota bacterium]MDE3192414.1 xanthine dehydrogenase family protein molybdopterin-binding subunit [Chloroflexota bacterium]
MPKKISTKRVLELLADPEFQLIASESPWAYQDELDAVNEYLIAITPKTPAHLRAAQPSQTSIVGRRLTRLEDPARLTGQAIFSSDVQLPGMLHAAILRSPHAHATIDSIDTSAAEALAGVRAVITYKNVPQVSLGGPPPQFILNQEVHFAGEEVAVVAADDIHTARDAVALIRVQYKVLPSITDPVAALTAGAPDLQGGGKGNKLAQSYPLTKRGSFDSAYAAAPFTVEGRYTTQTLQHATMEPRNAVAFWEGPDQLVVYAGTQYIMGVRAELATTFKLPRSHVRVIAPYVGGGFGDKSSSSRHGRFAAVLAQMTQRPVKVEYDRPGNFKAATHRYATVVDLKAGADRSGRIAAYRADAISDSGAYNAPSLTDVMVSIARLYHADNAYFQQAGTLTNRGPSGFQRCVGNPQGTFAQEVFMDELAEKAGVDPLAFRLMNVETKVNQDSVMPADLENAFGGGGEAAGSVQRKLPWASCGIVDCLQQGARSIGWSQKWHKPATAIKGNKAHGIGVSAHACAHGSMTMPMTAMMKIDQDGSLDVIQPTTDIGGGQSTTMMMIGAETVGVTLEDAHPSWGDSAFTPDSSGTNGSRQTISAGNAVLEAGLDLKWQLLQQATRPLPPKNAPMLPGKPEDLDTRDGSVFVKADPTKKVAIKDVVASTGGPMMGRGAHTIPRNYGMSTFAAGFAEVEVDLDTGDVTLLRYVGANDVGKAVNPLGVEQQMEGAISMSFGMALGEEMKFDPEQKFPVMWNWENYAMPTVLEHPHIADFRTIIVEPGDAVGPYGAKGVGEPPTSPPAPAIANAVYNAIGVRIRDLPITRDKVLAAIAQMQK